MRREGVASGRGVMRVVIVGLVCGGRVCVVGGGRSGHGLRRRG